MIPKESLAHNRFKKTAAIDSSTEIAQHKELEPELGDDTFEKYSFSDSESSSVEEFETHAGIESRDTYLQLQSVQAVQP